MEIKNSEWTDFAEFIARQSEHMCSQYWEDGTYIKCPFSTVERAYNAFFVWRACHSQSEVKKFWDVDIEGFNPELVQEEIEYAFKEAAGLTYVAVEDWEPDWDNYCIDRKKQITRIAHELADKHGRIPVFGDKSWMSLVYPFYKKYELNSDERALFVSEYYAQLYLNNGI